MENKAVDIVAVGTGFATTFFLHRFLRENSRPLRILVLEAGRRVSHAEQMAKKDPRWMSRTLDEYVVNRTPEKVWNFYMHFGGGSNCWFACTPRMLPEDFRLRSTYGVGADWPIDYNDLEPFYCDAEELMQISGSSGDSPYARSRPYPHPPHPFTEPEERLKAAFPGQVFSHPCARTLGSVPNQRPGCCSNRACLLCPIDAKFTILNGMRAVYDDPRVTVAYGARAQKLEYSGNAVTHVNYLNEGKPRRVACDLAVLGANGIFNPHIMMRSGLDDRELGRGLCEQVSRSVYVELDGLDNRRGSTVSTALAYNFYSRPQRRRKAAALVQTDNRAAFINERGRWLQSLQLNFIYEEFRLPENRVGISEDDPTKPEVIFRRRSKETDRGLEEIEVDLLTLLEPLPVRSYRIEEPWDTDSHIIGTTVMGRTPTDSVVDQDCIHHRLRNLLVLGSGAFPTAAPANPTLTLCALAMRVAARLKGAGAR